MKTTQGRFALAMMVSGMFSGVVLTETYSHPGTYLAGAVLGYLTALVVVGFMPTKQSAP